MILSVMNIANNNWSSDLHGGWGHDHSWPLTPFPPCGSIMYMERTIINDVRDFWDDSDNNIRYFFYGNYHYKIK